MEKRKIGNSDGRRVKRISKEGEENEGKEDDKKKMKESPIYNSLKRLHLTFNFYPFILNVFVSPNTRPPPYHDLNT